VIFGSFVFELYDYGKEYSLSNIRINNVLPIIIGFLAAFLSGLFAVKFLMRLSSRRNLNFFAVYCVILSLVFFVIYFLRK
jgi:undecaprenyl-diphosphatase